MAKKINDVFLENLRLLVKNEGSLASFAKKVNVSVTSVSRWIDGNTDPSISLMATVCQKLDVSLDWLYFGTTSNSNMNDLNDDFEYIKGYNIQASAGFGFENFAVEEPTRFLAFRKRWLKFRNLVADKLVVIFVKGDSMYPTIDDNDSILINTSNKTLTDGKIYVVRLGSQILVKRVQGLTNGVRLISDNKIYDSLDISEKELPDLEIIGQVVHVAHDL